jgi:hypothetical protein
MARAGRKRRRERVIYSTGVEELPPAPVGAPARLVSVDDPGELVAGGRIYALPGQKQRVWQILRDDPLGRLHCRQQIDDAQYHAGREMQGYYERSEIGNVKAMDTTKEPVDGGGIPDVLTEGQQKARKRVIELERALGLDGASIIRDFLACRMFVEQIAVKRRMEGERELRYLGRRLRECLERLAKELQYA